MPSIEYKISVFVFLLLCFFFVLFLVITWECKWRQISLLHVYTCLHLLGTTAFVLPCVADADPISFPELDLSENESSQNITTLHTVTGTGNGRYLSLVCKLQLQV